MALVSKREEAEKQKREDAEKKAEVWSLPPNAGMLEPASLSRLSFLTLSLHRFCNTQLGSKAWFLFSSSLTQFLSTQLPSGVSNQHEQFWSHPGREDQCQVGFLENVHLSLVSSRCESCIIQMRVLYLYPDASLVLST